MDALSLDLVFGDRTDEGEGRRTLVGVTDVGEEARSVRPLAIGTAQQEKGTGGVDDPQVGRVHLPDDHVDRAEQVLLVAPGELEARPFGDVRDPTGAPRERAGLRPLRQATALVAAPGRSTCRERCLAGVEGAARGVAEPGGGRVDDRAAHGVDTG